MTAEILPSGMAMTGNPILVKVTAFGEKYVQVSVKHANKEVFSTSGIPDTNGNIEFRIDEVLKMLLISRSIESSDLLVSIPEMTTSYSVIVKGQSGATVIISGECFTGGASKRELRKFVDVNILETFKILNRNGNFFLTTRTQSDLVSMRESEIYPLYFIHPDGIIRVEDSSGNAITLPEGTARKHYSS